MKLFSHGKDNPFAFVTYHAKAGNTIFEDIGGNAHVVVIAGTMQPSQKKLRMATCKLKSFMRLKKAPLPRFQPRHADASDTDALECRYFQSDLGAGMLDQAWQQALHRKPQARLVLPAHLHRWHYLAFKNKAPVQLLQAISRHIAADIGNHFMLNQQGVLGELADDAPVF
jgi:hypothetical protein